MPKPKIQEANCYNLGSVGSQLRWRFVCSWSTGSGLGKDTSNGTGDTGLCREGLNANAAATEPSAILTWSSWVG